MSDGRDETIKALMLEVSAQMTDVQNRLAAGDVTMEMLREEVKGLRQKHGENKDSLAEIDKKHEVAAAKLDVRVDAVEDTAGHAQSKADEIIAGDKAEARRAAYLPAGGSAAVMIALYEIAKLVLA